MRKPELRRRGSSGARPTSTVSVVALYRGEALLRVGGYRWELDGGEDLDLHLRLAEVGALARRPATGPTVRLRTRRRNHRHEG
jgi:hypothetical protein